MALNANDGQSLSATQGFGVLDVHQTRQKSLQNQGQSRLPVVASHDHAKHYYCVCESTRFSSFTSVRNLDLETALSRFSSSIGKSTPTVSSGITHLDSKDLLTPATSVTESMNGNQLSNEGATDDHPSQVKVNDLTIHPIKEDVSKLTTTMDESTGASINEESLEYKQSNSQSSDVVQDKEVQQRENVINVWNTTRVGRSTLVSIIAPNDDAKCCWTVEEDLRLLDAIEANGLGNWVDISEAISTGIMGGSNKTPKRCMERYWDDYLGCYGRIVPPFLKLKNGIIISSESIPGDKDLIELRQQRDCFSEATMCQVVGRAERYKVEIEGVKALAASSDTKEMNKIIDQCKRFDVELPPRADHVQELPGSEFAGFMPRRGDFDVEWENDAEHVLAGIFRIYFVITHVCCSSLKIDTIDMEFSKKDSDAERDLKLQVISIYNAKLDGRSKRKKFITDHKLLDTKLHEEMDKKRSRDERDLVQRMRLFARFQTPEEHEKFVEAVIETKRMRKDIAQLQFYRRMGIRSLAEAEKYELDKSRREYHRIEAAKDKKNSTAVDSALSSLLSQYISSKTNRMRENINDHGQDSVQTDKNVLPQSLARSAVQDISEGTVKNDRTSLKDNGCEFDLTCAPGVDLLSSKEISLCKKIQLLPEFYLEMKRELLQESLLHGFVEDGTSKNLVKVDIQKRGEIIQFMLSSGWIRVKN